MKIVSISQEEILFDNKMAITQQHEQDCCEAVYADFELKWTNRFTLWNKQASITLRVPSILV